MNGFDEVGVLEGVNVIVGVRVVVAVNVIVGDGVFVRVGVWVAFGSGVAVSVGVLVIVLEGVLVAVLVTVGGGDVAVGTAMIGGKPNTRATLNCSTIPVRWECRVTEGAILFKMGRITGCSNVTATRTRAAPADGSPG